MSTANPTNLPIIGGKDPEVTNTNLEKSQISKNSIPQNSKNDKADTGSNNPGNSLKGSTIQQSNRITRTNSKGAEVTEPENENDDDQAQEEENNYVHISCTSRLNLYDLETELKAAKDFYIKKLGFIQELPMSFLDSPKVSMIKLKELVEGLSMIDVQPTEQGLYWLGQLMYILPLPPFWDIKRKGKDHYIFEYQVSFPNFQRVQKWLYLGSSSSNKPVLTTFIVQD